MIRNLDLKYRMAKLADFPSVVVVYSDAIDFLEEQGIHQWDIDSYPTADDILRDIETQEMYLGFVGDDIAVAYTLNKELDEQYQNCQWPGGDNFIAIHRLCVSPRFQHHGVARMAIEHIHQESMAYGIKSIRLDAYVDNPYAISLYEHFGYLKRGEALWVGKRFNLYECILDRANPSAK